MKINIPPYPNFKVTPEAFKRDVEQQSVVQTAKDNITHKSTDLIMFAELKQGGYRMYRARPIAVNDRVYLSAFPNPIHLFLSLSVDLFLNSENIKTENFPKCGEDYGDNTYWLDIDESGTHECYNLFIQHRASSIIMLVSSIEAFMNHIIGNDYVYERTRRDGKGVEKLNKALIESPKVSFKEKLTEVIPKFLDKGDFWQKYSNELIAILGLYSHRKALIHLKTNSEDDLDRYFKAMDSMLGFDIRFAIDSTVKFMNEAKSDFIEYSTTETQ